MSNLFWLTDAQIARLQPFFPKRHGKPRVDDPDFTGPSLAEEWPRQAAH